MKQAVLLLTNKDSEKIIELYDKLKTELNDKIYDIFIIFHNNERIIPERFKNTNYIIITDEVFQTLKIKSVSNGSIAGNEFISMSYFFNDNRNYDYYWFMEDDVRFNGNWSYFFNEFENTNYDFISASVRWAKNDPEWNGVHRIFNSVTKENIPLEERLLSFNPIYRISNKANLFLFNMHVGGWGGWHEVLLATLLYRNNYTISDFGGNGDFVPKKLLNKFYHGVLRTFRVIPSQEMRDLENRPKPTTFTWRPPQYEMNIPNFLYHPVKDF